MMGERAVTQEALFYSFSLEGNVPENHLLRLIDRFVDLTDIRAYPPAAPDAKPYDFEALNTAEATASRAWMHGGCQVASARFQFPSGTPYDPHDR